MYWRVLKIIMGRTNCLSWPYTLTHTHIYSDMFSLKFSAHSSRSLLSAFYTCASCECMLSSPLSCNSCWLISKSSSCFGERFYCFHFSFDSHPHQMIKLKTHRPDLPFTAHQFCWPAEIIIRATLACPCVAHWIYQFRCVRLQKQKIAWKQKEKSSKTRLSSITISFNPIYSKWS